MYLPNTTYFSKKPRISTVQGLRAISVLAVLFFHAKVSWMGGGFVGVDAFFVISGFVISLLLKNEIVNQKFSFFSFYKRRAWRLMPALGCMLLITALIFGLLMPISENKTLFYSFISSSFGVSNFFFLRKLDYFDSGITNPVLHTWSLGVEEQFYLIFPLILYSIYKVRALNGDVNKRSLLLLFALVGLISAILQTSYNQSNAFYLPWFRYWEFMVGAVIAFVRLELISKWLAMTFSYIGISLLIASMIYYQEQFIFPGIGAIIPVIATAFVILGSFDNNKVNNCLSAKPIIFLGDISYSVYLVHWPIVCFIGLFLSLNNYKTQIIAIILSLFAGYLSWRFVEQKFRNGFKLIDNISKYFTPIILMNISCIAVVAIMLSTNYLWAQHQDARKYFNVIGQSEYLFRTGSCFLTTRNTLSEFNESECMNINSRKDNILVFGDSLAANMVLGFKETWPEKNVAQATAYNLKPGDFKKFTPIASELNKYIENKYLIRSGGINTVILIARWDENSINPLVEYVSRLKKMGKKVVVFGPFPEFYAGVPLLSAHSNIIGTDINQYFVKDEPFKLDKIFHKRLINVDRYISVVGILCPLDKCNFELDGKLIFFDKVHLTKSGVNLITSNISNY